MEGRPFDSLALAAPSVTAGKPPREGSWRPVWLISQRRYRANFGVEGAAAGDPALAPIRRASDMRRIGHAVLGSPKNQETVRWFRETLGLVCSDDVYAGDRENIIGQFSRIDAR